MYYLFDGSYPGFLCCVFEAFERKEFNAIPLAAEDFTGDLFQDNRHIDTDMQKAKRVQEGLKKQCGQNTASDFYRAFLSEDRKAWQAAFTIIHQVFKSGAAVLKNYGNDDVLYFTQILKKVSRERHRMKAFTRFSKNSDGLFFAVIEPDFNVLPLIINFFKQRYADQRWLIYDAKRNYGMLYDKFNVSEVQLTTTDDTALAVTTAVILDEKDELFRRLWKQYFKSTNIEARRNMKLHLQHVPKRYWKHLVEKN